MVCVFCVAPLGLSRSLPLCPGTALLERQLPSSVIREIVMALWHSYGVREIFGVQWGYRCVSYALGGFFSLYYSLQPHHYPLLLFAWKQTYLAAEGSSSTRSSR